MSMIKRYKTQIIVLSILSAAGIGYFVYSKIRIHNLNTKVQDLEEFQNQINNLPDVELNPEDTIPPDPRFFPTESFGANLTDGNVTTTGEYPVYETGSTYPVYETGSTYPVY